MMYVASLSAEAGSAVATICRGSLMPAPGKIRHHTPEEVSRSGVVKRGIRRGLCPKERCLKMGGLRLHGRSAMY